MRNRRCSTAFAAASESTAIHALLVKVLVKEDDASSQFEAEEEGSASYPVRKK